MVRGGRERRLVSGKSLHRRPQRKMGGNLVNGGLDTHLGAAAAVPLLGSPRSANFLYRSRSEEGTFTEPVGSRVRRGRRHDDNDAHPQLQRSTPLFGNAQTCERLRNVAGSQVCRLFLVARRHSSISLQTAEEAFNHIAVPVPAFVVFLLSLPRRVGSDASLGPHSLQPLANGIAVICCVDDHKRRTRWFSENRGREGMPRNGIFGTSGHRMAQQRDRNRSRR